MKIAEEFGVEYSPADPIRRKSSLDAEAASAAAAAAPGPQPAYEAPRTRRPSGGIADPPPVTAFAVPPSTGLPLAHATLSPQNSYGGGGGGGGGGGWDRTAAAHGDAPNRYTPDEPARGHYRDTSGSGGARRGSGGFEEATKGWGPSDTDWKEDGAGDGDGGKEEDAPPPYSPPRKQQQPAYDHADIPAAPSATPMAYDIPAAPG